MVVVMVMRAVDSPRIHGMEDEEPEGDIEQSETYHHEAHHGTAAEGNLQSLIET